MGGYNVGGYGGGSSGGGGGGSVAWVDITGKPTTIAGFGITDGVVTSDGRLSNARTPLAHNQAFSTIDGRPTTLTGYGITDAQPSDPELTAIAALAANGIIARTSGTTAATRTISNGTNITVTNGDGVAGNPTIAFSGTLATNNGGTGKADAGWASNPAAGTVLFLSRASTSAIDSLASLSLVTATSTFTMAGAFIVAPPVVAGATPPAAARITAAAHTNGTTAVEYSDVVWNLGAVYQRATGAVATQRTIVITPRTYSFVGASTITRASTLAISGPPIAGTNATLTRTWTLDIESGNARFAGQVVLDTIGSGVQVREGANAMQGVATLVGGTVTVSHSTIQANSRILLTGQDNLVTGALRVSARTVNTSFTITSSNAGDTGVVAYEIFTPAP